MYELFETEFNKILNKEYFNYSDSQFEFEKLSDGFVDDKNERGRFSLRLHHLNSLRNISIENTISKTKTIFKKILEKEFFILDLNSNIFEINHTKDSYSTDFKFYYKSKNSPVPFFYTDDELDKLININKNKNINLFLKFFKNKKINFDHEKHLPFFVTIDDKHQEINIHLINERTNKITKKTINNLKKTIQTDNKDLWDKFLIYKFLNNNF